AFLRRGGLTATAGSPGTDESFNWLRTEMRLAKLRAARCVLRNAAEAVLAPVRMGPGQNPNTLEKAALLAHFRQPSLCSTAPRCRSSLPRHALPGTVAVGSGGRPVHTAGGWRGRSALEGSSPASPADKGWSSTVLPGPRR